ncbi:LOW QUALITY PROTEIN: protein LEG1 homolog [Moschus berezovskii]|uniref:LOW QUALITY PROTEIN: protein LEG1 homolog n=1 Tax=Moschus berezovskii TaxID=68408 RepID=UPI002444E95E|nr:LOW QUALITY PROTEIN: protein LEG1 homolog [Moschus berezovskii]
MWSSLVIPTFLFLSFSSVGLAPDPGSATDENDNYPPFWDQTEGDIAEFPVQNNKTIVDPWKYIDRLRIYKILIEESNKYFASFGKNNTGNVLWALTLLYGKLFKTDRFSEPPKSSRCAYESGASSCISVNSGWGGINYYVIIMYFLAAIESEFLGNLPYEVELLSQEEYRSNFCYSVEECHAAYPQVMDIANRFYKYLQSRKIVSTTIGIPQYDTDEDTVIFNMWAVHQAAIDVAKPKISDVLFYVSETERDFTMDFLLAVELVEAVLYCPHFETMTELLVGFPHRLLTDQDHNVLTSNLSRRKKAVMTVAKLTPEINKSTGGLFLTIWKKLMTSKFAQPIGRFLINRLLLIPIE